MAIGRKQRTDHWLERTVEESTGLWSRVINYRSELIPELRTVETLGKFLTEDRIRHESWGVVADFVRRARGDFRTQSANAERERGRFPMWLTTAYGLRHNRKTARLRPINP